MKTVYVNKEGVICACTVEVPAYPEKPGPMSHQEFFTEYYEDDLPAYDIMLKACKESAVPFEDQEEAHQNIEQRLCIYELKPDTFYQIEADWEIVTECECLNFDPKIPCALNDKHCKGTKLARLKVSSPEDNKEQDDLWNEVGGIFFRAKGFKAYDHVLKELKESGFTITRKPLS